MRVRRCIVLVALTLVAGCGGDDGDTPAAEPAPKTRLITHAMGSTEVPVEPKRVVVLDTPQLDATAALGIRPVGATRTDVSDDLPALAGKPGEIAEVGTIQQPNLEAVAALRPDLILSSTVRHKDLYDELSAIAPSVFAGTVAEGWKQNFVLFADALGRRADAERLLAEYEQRADAVGARLAAEAGNPTVGILRFLPDEIRIYGPESFSGSVLVDLGVDLPKAVAGLTGKIAATPSIEQVGQADADILFVTTYGDPAKSTAPAVRGGPIWPRLPAVVAGRVHEVSDDKWMLAIGVVGANGILDDIEAALF